MKVAIITDTHQGLKQDSPVFIKHMERFYLDVFFPYLEEHQITRILHGGDVVDRRKNMGYVALHSFRNSFLEETKRRGIEVDGIVGNHDVPFRNTNDINSMKELLGDEYPNIRFYHEPTEIDLDGTKIAMLPWINRENYDDSMKFVKKTKATILLGHLELAGFQMLKGVQNTHGMDSKPFEKFDMVWTGHFHHRSSKANIHYLGAPFQMSWGDYNDPKGFHVFDTDTRRLEFVRNTDNIYLRHYYDDKDKVSEDILEHNFAKYEDKYVQVSVRNADDQVTFDAFIESLQKANPTDLKIIQRSSVLRESSNTNIEVEDTMSVIRSAVDRLDTKANKKVLMKEMQSLYQEALAMEK